MIVGTVEDAGLEPEAVRDDLTLRIQRYPRPAGQPIAEHEGLWVGRLRRIGAAKLRHWGIPGLVEDAELAISELVTNALLHGAGGKVAFRILLAADMLALEVDDGSPERAHVNTADPDDENGRGMFIVSALSTVCGVSPDGTKTWCTFTIPTTPRRSAAGPREAVAGTAQPRWTA
ncbi:ATP-binding protein [Streptomyces sp. NPDC093707]|uniref:ATP-binding protein n=1 Tax=Streptomyces sp. NPDC093707 TaxID=3154984 RepID=UPI00344E14D5